MDIEKLESLGCLKLPQEMKPKMIESLSSIMEMMHDIDQLELPDVMSEEILPTKLREDVVNEEFTVKKDSNVKGLHLEEELFLAPKTIRK
jgi:Asp-tRNA(Asn)/Glu-tRNA(Gln) amidotransferase C subunit